MKPALIILAFISGLFAFRDVPTTNSFVSGNIAFTIKNMGLTVGGKMDLVDIQFSQPTADPATWQLEGTASPGTIATGIGIRDKHLKKTDYFDVEHHPLIRMQSSGIRLKGKNNYEGSFSLTIKGITKTVTVPFSISENADAKNITGEFTINRLDYGLGEESAVLSDNVKIRVTGTFKNE
jgi:polyisoprenoid-binding protein YceI